MEEKKHVGEVIQNAIKALQNFNSQNLRELSNQTIHSASLKQDSGSITLAVLIYTLSKIIERNDHLKVKNWNKLSKKIVQWLELSKDALEKNNLEKYEEHLKEARKTLSQISPNLKEYIKEVLRKAEINKASRIYEHGISMEKTAQLLGITQWEFADYLGTRRIEEGYSTFDIKKRARIALEFFS